MADIDFGDMFTVINPDRYSSRDWQEEDLANLVEREGSANWSEMGCFKTTTGLWLAQRKIERLGELNFTPSILIITSRNGKGTYYDALPKTLELDGYRVFDVTVNGVTERVSGIVVDKWEISDWYDMIQNVKSKWVLIAHYHCFTNKSPVRQWLQRLEYTFIIVDEAHRIKNKDGQWTRHIKKLTALAGKHVMTGTGFVNNPAEIWSLLNFVEPNRWTSYRRFLNHFCEVEERGDWQIISGVNQENKDEFRELVRSYGPRREMREVHKDIQEPIFTTRHVDLNQVQRKMYDQIRTYLQMLDQKGEPISSPNVLSLLNRLRQICVATPELVSDYYHEILDKRIQEVKLVEPSSKLDEFEFLLYELRWDEEVKHKVVVFSQFKDPLFLLEERLKKRGVPYLHMQAHHNDETRYKMWHDLWPGPDHQVFLSTLDLGGESINLTAAQYCVFLDRSWSPRANNQAIGRVYRPGQTGAVEIIYIDARNTTDQYILAKNEMKTGWFKEIFGDDK